MTTNHRNNETNQRLERLESGQEELRAGQKDLWAGQEELRAGQEDLRQTVTRIERSVDAIRNDIGPLKAAHARNSALRVSYRVCEDLGLDEIRVLDRNALRAMVRQADTLDLPRNHRYSFIEADAVIEATNDAGETHYVAMEASFTADERDTNRAVRNAGYLTRFTGQPAHAVVAALRIDNRIADVITSGQVHWCRLDEEDLQID